MSKLKFKNIVIFGPQGSGKGTQADVLAEKFGIPHISTGEIFRENIKNKTELGQAIEKLMSDGHLVPDGITNNIVKERLNWEDCAEGFVLDGYPRTLNQAEFLGGVKKIDLMLEVWISDDEAVMRIGGRRTCPKCGAIYHLKFRPPAKDEVCDKDGEKLIIRDDDREEAVRARLETYHKQTEPVIEYYKNSGIYKKVDGMPPIPVVTEEILKIIANLH